MTRRVLQEEGTVRAFVDNLEKPITRRGLYCVWEPVREGERTRLVARWIDPDAPVSEADNDTHSNNEEEPRRRCLSGSARAA
jgi:hypothetical protein